MRWQMRGGTRQSRKMMGRGAEGGCGTEETPCPLSRVSSHPPFFTTVPTTGRTAEEASVAGADGVDFFAQARKALAERSPFDSEEAAARVTTLPVSLAVAYARHADGRRKFKKAVSAEQGKKAKDVAPPPAPAARNVWTETEEYFRDVTLEDVDWLVPKLPSLQDPCFLVPALPGLLDKVYTDGLSGAVEEEKPSAIPNVTDGQVLETVVEESELAAADDNSHVGEVEAAGVGKEVGVAMEEGAVEEGDERNYDMMDIDEEDDDHVNDGDVGVVQEKEECRKSVFSLNWVLGSKYRDILTSGRPNKKRKISGCDAGLERLFVCRHSVHQELPICDYCCSNRIASITNQMLCCDSCKVSVHQKCYGISDHPGSAWLCSWCRHSSEIGRPSTEGGSCLLCPKKGGALKPVGEHWCTNKEELAFAHLFCSLWTPEVYVDNVELMEPILNIEGIQVTRKKLVCHVCKVKHGPCVRCSYGTCRESFHPICARESNHRMEIWGRPDCNNVELRVFCSKHNALQDITSAQHVATMVMRDDNGSLEDNGVTMRLPSNEIMESRLIHSDTMVDPNTDVTSDVMNRNVKPLKHDTVADKLMSNGADDELNVDKQTIDLLNDNLIEKRKIKMNDVALGIGVSANSLEAALVDVPDAFPPIMGLKLARWLEDSASMASLIPMGLAKPCGGNGASLIAENSVVDALSEGPSDLNIICDLVLDKHDAVPCKSQPKHWNVNSNKRQLIETEIMCPLESSLTRKQDNGSSFGDVNDYSQLSHGDEKRHGGMGSAFVAENRSKQKEDKENVWKFVPPSVIGRGLERASYFLLNRSEYQGVDQVNESTLGMVSADHSDVGGLISGTPVDKGAKLSDYYMNMFIKKRLMQINSSVKVEECQSGGCSAAAESTYRQKAMHFSSVPMEDLLRLPQPDNAAKIMEPKLKDLAKDKTMGILELSPDDEVEGDILQLQNKLLDTAVMIKHHHERLIFKVACTMSKELDAMKQKRWDSLLVSRFLREVREAKKRGKKERRHREAQAILAAATAAAASSRVSLPKQDTKDIAGCGTQEGHATVEAASGNQSSLHQKAKEKPLKLSVSKLSYGKNSDTNVLSCDICKREDTLMNPIFVCGSCKVPVHLDCYRRCKDPVSTWYCEPCEALISQSKSVPTCLPQCGLCGTTGGAFRKITEGQWVHAFCAEWIFESTFRRGQEHAVDGMDTSLKKMDTLCCICHQKIGVCVKCAYGHCKTAFHPLCARNAGLYLNTKFVNSHMQLKAYCQKHSQEQRDKAERPGVEELRGLQQIRVELEKLRLLCERIIKREKLKRELVLCSHGILSSRREYTAFSMLVRSRALHSGISSESATTTENITSYSETVERSDDITVDSTVSSKHKVIIPSRTSSDKRTSERSRPRLPSVQKVIGGDRTLFSGKQLPWRPTCAASDATDEERKVKPRKRAEIFQKEVMMTSDQALKQNQRLPKGFVYVPIDSLPKPKDIESREPQLPDG